MEANVTINVISATDEIAISFPQNIDILFTDVDKSASKVFLSFSPATRISSYSYGGTYHKNN